MNIIILGAKGTLGTALTELLKQSHTVFPFDRAEFDLFQFDREKERLADLKPDVIINASAINAVDDIETNDEIFDIAKRINGTIPGEIAEFASQLDVPFIHYSTDYIFDGESDTAYDEVSDPKPLSRYGESKLLGEKEVQKKGNKYYIIRLSRLFGPAGESAHGKRSFVDTMLALADSDRDHLSIVDDQVSCPTYSKDLAEFTKELFEKEFPYGIYHGANEGAATWYDWAAEVFRLTDKTIETERVPHTKFPRPAKVPAFSELQNTKGPKMRNWKEALADYLENK